MAVTKVSIDEFVRKIAARLPEQRELVRIDKTFMLGSELKLTGVKDFRGKPIEDDQVYELEVPVYKGKFEWQDAGIEDGLPYAQMLPTIKRADHEAELRRAYLSKGLPGIYSYLAPYLSPASLQQVKDMFMRANNK